MANENDALQQNNNNNNNNNGVDAIATVGVTLTTSNATDTLDIPLDEGVGVGAGAGDLTHLLAGDKDKVSSTGGGDCGAGGANQTSSTTATVMSAAAATVTSTTAAATKAVRGKLNDLVADLCINGPLGNAGNTIGGYGDYTSTRATTAPTVYIEGSAQHKSETQPHSMPAPTQNPSSSFSFKHFLSSSQTLTAPSSTVTVTTIDSTAASSSHSSSSVHPNSIAGSATSSNGSNPLQTSTGARPKVPQSASLSSTSISSLIGGGSGGGSGSLLTSGAAQDGGAFGSSATKMKRSPRFSSFDSQASLAEYAAVGADAETEASAGSGAGGSGVNSIRSNVGGISGTSTGFRLYPDALSGESSDFFSSTSRITRGIVDGSTLANNSNDYDRHQYVPRSYSNYDMPMPSASASPRRRGAVVAGGGSSCSVGSAGGGGGGGSCGGNSGGGGGLGSLGVGKEARPTRLSLNTNTNTSKLKLDLPIDDAIGGSGAAGGSSSVRPLPNNAGEFPTAAAAALPDFVQDHWMDSWYAHDMHLNSPPNSPIRDFGDDVAGGAVAGGAGGGGIGAGGGADVVGRSSVIGIPGPAPAYCGSGVETGAFGGGSGPNETTAGNSKMLPDFLSDGPIIHSSQRLADVTVGLPSNSIGSPDDPPMSSQLSRLRIENDRLQRELNDARMALNEQTRRANDLERQQQERQRSDANAAAYNRSMAQNATLAEENLDKSKRRAATSQNHVLKLKQQVTQLTAEVELLRRENESLREEGAVGGLSVPCCERTRPYATETTAAAAAAAAGVRASVGRPHRTQQISRDLLRAASTAENNLRQLLVGVDNLRQMAADIENSELRVDYDAVSPDLFSVFDDCDEYEDYSGGPAL